MPSDIVSQEVPSRRPLPRSVWILSFVSFFADVSSEMLYPLLPLFLMSVLHATKMELGAMEGAAVLLVAMMSAVAGMRSDRQGLRGGRVRWIRWGYGLPVLGKAIIALATIWPIAISGRLLDRFGKGLRGAPRDALIADAVSPDQRGRAFGLHRALDTAGAIVGVLIAALLLWWLSDTPLATTQDSVAQSAIDTPAWIYRIIFGVGAILGLLSWLLTLTIREPNRTPAPPSLDANHPFADHGTSEPATGLSRKRLNLPTSFWYTLAVFVVFSLANSSDAFLLLRIQELGYSPWAVVMSYALFNIVYSVLSYPAGSLSDRIGRWRVIGLGWVLYAIVYAAFACLPASQAWGVWPLMAFYGAYMALTEGVGKALIADQAPPESRGTAMGLFYGATGLSTFLASVITGLVWDQYGSTAALMLGSAFAGLGLCFSAVVIAIHRKRSD